MNVKFCHQEFIMQLNYHISTNNPSRHYKISTYILVSGNYCFKSIFFFFTFQTYVIDVIRKQIPRFVKLTDEKLAKEYECPFTLSALYRPITIRGSNPKNTYSAPNIDEKTRKSKIDPLSGMPLGKDWRIVDYELDKKIAVAMATIPLTNGSK